MRQLPPQSLPRRFTACITALLVVVDVTSVGCKSSAPTTPTTPAPTAAAAPAAQTTPAGPATSQMSLDDLVAPIALYPDQLLGQLLVAAVNSQEVLDLGNWLIQNQNIKPDAAPAAAKAAGFSPSAQYLAAFPQVVDNMCQEFDWTKQLGEAFQGDQKGVMDAIQQKRAEAKQQGNLQSGPQMTVETTTQNNQQVIEIKPANPDDHLCSAIQHADGLHHPAGTDDYRRSTAIRSEYQERPSALACCPSASAWPSAPRFITTITIRIRPGVAAACIMAAVPIIRRRIARLTIPVTGPRTGIAAG